MATEKVRRKSRGSLKSNSVNAKVTKFDTAVLRHIRRSNPAPEKLVAFIQDEWLKKTKSYLPATTAKKIAKRFAHLQTSTHVKVGGKTRKQKKQRGGAALVGAPLTDTFGPGSLAPTLLKMPADITQSSQFAASSPVSYFSIAQDRGIPAGGWEGYGPKPGMGDNTVARSRRRQRGGAAFSIPGSVPMNLAEMGINTSIGVRNPIMSTGNPVIPGFSQTYVPLKGTIDNSAAQITGQLPLVWKTTA
jgi:hypothetical protein